LPTTDRSAVYVDTSSDDPAFATVKVGMIGRHRSALVPLDGPALGPDHLLVHHARKQVQDVASIDTDGELTTEVISCRPRAWRSAVRRGSGGQPVLPGSTAPLSARGPRPMNHQLR
jgi:hypothetical protein